MATWSGLGIATPVNNQWITLNLPTLGGETFRVSFFGLGPSPENRKWASSLLIDTVYATGESGVSKRVWVSEVKEIIHLPIPPDLLDAGLTVRYLRVKKLWRYGVGRVVEPGWSCEIEEFIP